MVDNLEAKRYEWLDALKGLGIFLVTFGHLKPNLYFEKYIYSFHMCLFFLISGYLFKKPLSLKEFALKKFKSLIIPFLIWDFFSSIYGVLSGLDIKVVIDSFFILHGQLGFDAPIWFLLVLFFTEILYSLIMMINNRTSTSGILFLSSTFLWTLIGTINLPLKINLIPIAMMFYALGDMIKKNKINKSINTTIVSFILFCTSIIFGAFINTRISYTAGNFGNIYCCIVASTSGALFYFTLFQSCFMNKKFRVLNVLGQNSLIIMCTQYWLFKLINIIFGQDIWHTRNTLKALIESILVIVVIIAGSNIAKRISKNSKFLSVTIKYLGIK